MQNIKLFGKALLGILGGVLLILVVMVLYPPLTLFAPIFLFTGVDAQAVTFALLLLGVPVGFIWFLKSKMHLGKNLKTVLLYTPVFFFLRARVPLRYRSTWDSMEYKDLKRKANAFYRKLGSNKEYAGVRECRHFANNLAKYYWYFWKKGLVTLREKIEKELKIAHKIVDEVTIEETSSGAFGPYLDTLTVKFTNRMGEKYTYGVDIFGRWDSNAAAILGNEEEF